MHCHHTKADRGYAAYQAPLMLVWLSVQLKSGPLPHHLQSSDLGSCVPEWTRSWSVLCKLFCKVSSIGTPC